MTKRQVAALIAAVTIIASSLGALGHQAVASGPDLAPRVSALELRQASSDTRDMDIKERLDRIEQKLDRLIERR